MLKENTKCRLVHICAWCNQNIQDDNGLWTKAEIYPQARSGLEFTHGICPDCKEKFLSEYTPGYITGKNNYRVCTHKKTDSPPMTIITGASELNLG